MILGLSGICMVGQGTRMLFQGIFEKGSTYSPNTFDIFFDWATLSVCGGILFTAMVTIFYRSMKERSFQIWYRTCPRCGGSFSENIRKKNIVYPICGTEGIMDAQDFSSLWAPNASREGWRLSSLGES